MHHRSHDQYPGEGSASKGGMSPYWGGGGWAEPPSPELGKWAVRILLECFLVLSGLFKIHCPKEYKYLGFINLSFTR